jgi:hypothetical protein
MERPYALERAAQLWRTSVLVAEAFVNRHPSQSRTIRYEELVCDPRTVVASLCDFLGVSFREEILASEKIAATMGDVPALRHHAAVAEPITTARIGKGRQKLDRAQREVLDSLIQDVLQQFGYPRCVS